MRHKKDVDILIIGSGPAGGVMADEISASLQSQGKNLKICVVDSGPETNEKSYSLNEVDAVNFFQEGATRMTKNQVTQIVQGRIVGGGSLLYAAVAQVPPAEVFETWTNEMGLSGLSFADLRPHYEAMGQKLNRTAHKDPSQWNDNNRYLYEAMKARNYRHNIVYRYVKDCIGCGFCYLGCRYERKLTSANPLLSEARQRGVELIANCHVEKLHYDEKSKKVTGATAKIQEAPKGTIKGPYKPGPLQIRAKLVILCGGAFNSPHLLQKTEALADDLGPALGRYLIMQVALTNTLMMRKPVSMAYGIPETTSLTEFRTSHGFHLKCANHHPVSFASDIPGFGSAYKQDMANFERSLQWELIAYDQPRADNRIRTDRKGRMEISYDYSDEYIERILFGLRVTAEMALSKPVGAEKIFVGPSKKRYLTPEDLPRLSKEVHRDYWIPHLFELRTAHPQGGCRIGRDPSSSVVTENGRPHGLAGGLIVADTSVNPSSVYGHPSFTAYALARKISHDTIRDLDSLLGV